jgi:hypothetical protein
VITLASNIAKLPELLHVTQAKFQCPLLGVKRTLHGHALMSASDPKRTSGGNELAAARL